MNFVKLVFKEHICRINHKETSMTLSATNKIWRKTTRNVVSISTDVIQGSYRVIFFAQLWFKPIGEGEIFHSCNKLQYFFTVLQYIVIYSFPYIFIKIKLISQYSS